TPSTTVEDVSFGRGRVILTILDDTESRLEAFAIPEGDGPAAAGSGTGAAPTGSGTGDVPAGGGPDPANSWRRLPVEGLPEHVSIDVLSLDRHADPDAGDEASDPDDAVLSVSGPIVPPSLVLLRAVGVSETPG